MIELFFLGLLLEINVEQQQYIGPLTVEAGVRVLLHGQGHMIFPFEEGFSVSPGMSTSVGIKKVSKTTSGVFCCLFLKSYPLNQIYWPFYTTIIDHVLLCVCRHRSSDWTDSRTKVVSLKTSCQLRTFIDDIKTLQHIHNRWDFCGSLHFTTASQQCLHSTNVCSWETKLPSGKPFHKRHFCEKLSVPIGMSSLVSWHHSENQVQVFWRLVSFR